MYWAKQGNKRWYVSQDGKAQGPYPEERLAVMVQWGKISRDAYICDEQCSTWVPIKRSSFAALFPELPPAEAAPRRRRGEPLTKGDFVLMAVSFVLASALGTVVLL